jgi:Peptidase_C39 like family
MMRHRTINTLEKEQLAFTWEETNVLPFTELILSWSAQRPQEGHYLFQMSFLFSSEESPWLNYAYWGKSDQRTFNHELSTLRIYQDLAETLEGQQAIGFRVRVLANEGANLNNVRALHVCLTNLHTHQHDFDSNPLSIDLEISGLSQMVLPNERHLRLCSPVSSTAAIRYLQKNATLCPLKFANRVWDSHFDIYGNWVLNTAQASHELGDGWQCYVSRLNSFSEILENLHKKYPVVVSVKGPLAGSALPYASGHLIVVKGYEPSTRRVLCMDPGFPEDSLTSVSYDLDDFLVAWNRRKGLAYLFSPLPQL